MRPVLTPRVAVLLGCACCLILWAAHAMLGGLPSQQETYAPVAEGSFGAAAAGGPEPGLPCWSSGAGRGPGAVALGPFPAPDRLRFGARGDPGPGGGVYLELEITRDRIALAVPGSGDKWGTVDLDVPFGWRGRPVTLHARIGPSGAPAGFALSQPFGRGTGGERRYGLAETLMAWLANGILYGAVFAAFARALARRGTVRACWVPLAACALTALVGYAAFWAYFASPALGKLLSCAVLLAALAAGILPGGRFAAADREWLCAGCAAALAGLLYLGILHLFPAHLDVYDLAANRFIAGSPGDGRLPFDFADLLYHGQRPRELGAGWLSSDRPPLQEGWQLIAWPVTQAMGLSDQASSVTAAVWLQLSWVFALYGVLRSSGIRVGRALFWVAAAALNGFFLFHTLFTWPKLSAGAFVCGAFGMWVLGGCPSPARGVLLGAVFAGLAWLSHGGAAFSLFALLPWIAWRMRRGERAPWVLAALAFALVVAPWAAYQRCFAPPGNRLLKWHLAGQSGVNATPVWRAVADAYGSLTWGQVLELKASNLAFQFGGDWPRAAGVAPASAEARRHEEYFHAFRALGWWNLAVPLLAASLLRPAARARLAASRRLQGALGAWIAATLVLWCALMFTQAEIAHSSFAMMIALFALYALWIEAVGAWGLPCLAVLQALVLAGTWVPGSPVVFGPASAAAVALVAAAVAGGTGLILGCGEAPEDAPPGLPG